MANVETFRTKEDGYLLIIVKLVDKKQNLIFALDPWKFGYVDFESTGGSFKEIKRKIGLPSIKFHKIEKLEAAKILRQNYEISLKVGVEIPNNVINWFKKLGVLKIEHSGTIYKCFSCGKRDLEDKEINEILEIAKQELNAQNIGSEDEEQYFYVCQVCKDEMHDSHT